MSSWLRRPVGEVAAAAIGWWLAEMAALLPGGWRPGPAAPVVLAGPRGIGGLAAAAAAGRPAELRVPPDWVLSRTLRLPEAVRANLAGAVAAEIDRVTPFAAEAVLFTHSLQRRDGDEIIVDLAVLPRRLVAAPLDQLAAAGIAVGRIVAASAPPWLVGRSFLAGGVGARPARLSPPALALLALALLAPEAAGRWQAARGDTALVAAKAEAAETLRLARVLANRRAGLSDLDAERAARPAVSRLLADLTAALPDSAYLDALTVEGEAVTMAGHAQSAAGLIPALGRGGRFGDVHFEGAILRDETGGREHFQIIATYRPNGEAGQ